MHAPVDNAVGKAAKIAQGDNLWSKEQQKEAHKELALGRSVAQE